MQRTDENQLFHEHFPRLAIYLMQFADGNRIDLTIAPVEDYRPYCFDDKLSVVLLDKDGFLPHLPPPDESTHAVERPSAQVFQECRNEFWWTAPYMSKGLWRGQLPYAQHILEECTRPMLRLMLSWLAGSQKGFPVFPGKAGWNLENLLPQGVWQRYLGHLRPPAAACPCGTPCGRPVCCSPRPAATPPRPWGTPGRTAGTSPCPCLWRRHKRTSPALAPAEKLGRGAFAADRSPQRKGANAVNILCIGDVVGSQGCQFLRAHPARLEKDKGHRPGDCQRGELRRRQRHHPGFGPLPAGQRRGRHHHRQPQLSPPGEPTTCTTTARCCCARPTTRQPPRPGPVRGGYGPGAGGGYQPDGHGLYGEPALPL